MAFSFSPNAIARGSARRPWLVVGAWLVLFIVSVVLTGAFLSSALTTDADITAHPESKKGDALLEERLRGPKQVQEAVIVRSTARTVDDAAFKAKVDDLYTRITGLGPDVTQQATSFYASQNAGLVSPDRHTTIIPITMAGSFDDASDSIDGILDIAKESNGKDGFEVYVSGNASVGKDFQEQSEKDIARGETIGGVVALIILVLVFGAVVAALIPLLLSILAIVAALGLTAVAGQAFQFSFFAENMITMMGLAVGIDYSLFVLSRFREERARGREVLEAVDIASSTAGHAVLFSGMTVIIALCGMLIVPSTIYRSLAAGAIFAVSFAILASLTLLPALMRLLGDKVNALHLPFVQKAQEQLDEERPGGFWDRVAQVVMKHPVVGAVVVTSVLVAFAIPYFDLHTGTSGVTTLPDSFQSKKGFEILASEFSGGQVYPAELVLDGDVNAPATKAAIDKLGTALKGDDDFGPLSTTVNQDGNLALVSIQMPDDPNSDAATDAIKRLRSDYVAPAFAGAPVQTYVTGFAAINVDSYDITASYTPIVFTFVLGLSFLLLMIVFRSIVVPAKAIIMNLLSVGAAYGLIVLVCQKGVGADLLGFQQVEAIEFWLPLFLFSVLFGLSMDYHVFLLSRIRERYDQSNDNTDAVAFGLRSTGRLITGAALIMVAVFGGFAMGDLVMLQQIGFGLGVAVLIDATIIRSILVPSSMKLLGRTNWYLPTWLHWLPRIGVEDHVASATPKHYVSDDAPSRV